MRSAESFYIEQKKKTAEAKILYFSIPGLLTDDRKLAMNVETRTLSLLCNGPLLIRQELFSVNEMRVILPILQAFPHYCPYEVLLAHLSSNLVSEASINRCRERLQEAQLAGTWQQELRAIRRALSSLRNKLHSFDLEISNVRERGCNLTSLTSTLISRSSS